MTVISCMEKFKIPQNAAEMWLFQTVYFQTTKIALWELSRLWIPEGTQLPYFDKWPVFFAFGFGLQQMSTTIRTREKQLHCLRITRCWSVIVALFCVFKKIQRLHSIKKMFLGCKINYRWWKCVFIIKVFSSLLKPSHCLGFLLITACFACCISWLLRAAGFSY